VDKHALVALKLLLAFEDDAAWRANVLRVSDGEDELDVAAEYASGLRRKRVIANLLVHAAAGDGPSVGYMVPEDGDPSAAGSSRYSVPFWWRIERGAACIVRRGGRRCLGCGTMTRTGRVDYCAREECVKNADEIADRDAMQAVFAHLVTHAGHGPHGAVVGQ
jgi:hypothetical protein